VVLLNYQSLANASSGTSYPVFEGTRLSSAGSVCVADGPVKDICFSPDYKYLLVTTAESCSMYFTGYGSAQFASPGTELSLASTLPTTSKTLSSGMFVGSATNKCAINSILTASTNNRVLQLWKPKNVDDWRKSHEIILEADTEVTPWTNVGVDTTGHCILIATVNCSFFNVIHLNHSNDEFDHISKWEIAHPILSFSTGFPSLQAVDETNDDQEMNIFCMQTKAIQKYTIQAKQCGHYPSQAALSVMKDAEASESFQVRADLTVLGMSGSSQAEVLDAPAAPKPVSPHPSTLPDMSAPLASIFPPSPPVRVVSGGGGGGGDASDMEDRLLRAVSEMMDDKLARERQLLSKEFDTKLNKFADAMSKSIQANVTNAVENRTKKHFSDLESKMKSSIQSATQSQFQSMKSALQNDNNKMKDELVANVMKDVKVPIQTSFRECFVQLLMPTLETSTQRMFDQIDASIAEKFSNIPSPSGNIPHTSTTEIAPKDVDPREELDALLIAGEYDEALMKALGAKDVDLVMWLCSRVNVDMVHDLDLSQPVILCLLQQLTRDLGSDTSLKINWLIELAIKFDAEDEELAGHIVNELWDIRSKVKEFQQSDQARAGRTELIMILRCLPDVRDGKVIV